MRGASALEQVLDEKKDARLRLYVVWEPVIASDVAPPSTQVMALVGDGRVRQFWDPERVLSRDIVRAWHGKAEKVGHSAEEMAKPDFVVWDWVAVFDRRARWTTDMPEPAFAGGDVVSVTEPARREVANQLQRF